MKKLFLLALPIILFSCFRGKKGSGNVITETRTVAAFNAVNVAGSITVELTQGSKNEVVVEADDNIIKYVDVVNNSGVLTIRLKYQGNLRKFTARVKVTSPAYNSITATASSSVEATNLLTATDKISIDVNNSSDVDLNIDAPNVLAECRNSGTINLKGKARNLEVSSNNSGDINAENLKAETVIARASSSGSVDVFASVKLDANATSSGSINYTGGVKDIQKRESSSGSVSSKYN